MSLTNAVEWLLRNGAKKGTSLWQRNVELALPCLVFALVGVALSDDRKRIAQLGFFHGYAPLVWSIIFFQAVGGLTIALVVRQIGVLGKGFAGSMAIVVSGALSAYSEGLRPSSSFISGSSLVVLATFLYSLR